MPRIVIEDGLNASMEKTGIGSYTRRLLESLNALNHEFEVKFVEFELGKRIKNYTLRRALYRFWKNFIFEYFHLKKGDILHITHFRSSILRRTGIFRVYTIHDLVAKNYKFCLPSHVRKSAVSVVDKAVEQANEIIVPNDFIKNELLSTYNNKVQKKSVNSVIYSALSLDENSDVDKNLIKHLGKYFLFTGTIEIRKNLLTLIEAYEFYRSKYPKAKCNLVLVGKEGYGSKEVILSINRSPFKKEIFYLNFVPKKMLFSLFEHTTAFIFPSFYEGFGLPALEAVAQGRPVIASDIGTFREIGNKIFDFYGNPTDVAKLAYYMHLAESKKLPKRKYGTMTKEFTQKKVALSHLNVYRKYYNEQI